MSESSFKSDIGRRSCSSKTSSSGTRSRFRGPTSKMEEGASSAVNNTNNGTDGSIMLSPSSATVALELQGDERATHDKKTTEYFDYGEIISALSNFSIQYNLGVIAPALCLLDHTRGTTVRCLWIQWSYPIFLIWPSFLILLSFPLSFLPCSIQWPVVGPRKSILVSPNQWCRFST